MSTGVLAVVVVVPARDERDLIGQCLDALEAAVERVELQVLTVVVLDSCTDDTESALCGRRVVAVASTAGCVGAARAAGVRTGLARLPGIPVDQVWIASTDADSAVDPSWLQHQIALADAGADLWLGTVRLARDSAPAPLAAAWTATYSAADDHHHVHGANLGVRASAYRRVGGFAPVSVDEDVHLADAVAPDPAAMVVRSAAAPVTTSGRRVGRAPDGFAAYLEALDEQAG